MPHMMSVFIWKDDLQSKTGVSLMNIEKAVADSEEGKGLIKN